MLNALFQLYKKFEENKTQFTDLGLNGDFFIDVYRSQPFEPELYEYFTLPAIFVDYTMLGQGLKQPRSITLTLHVVTDDMPDISNMSEQKMEGFKRFLYNAKIQEILEGSKLGSSKPLTFISETPIDEPVINYHTQTYSFESYLDNLIGVNPQQILGEFERLNIFGSLNSKIE